MGYIMVFITTPTQENAEKISSMLVEEKLAACVSTVGEVKSTFYWEGKIEKEKESYYDYQEEQVALLNWVERKIRKAFESVME